MDRPAAARGPRVLLAAPGAGLGHLVRAVGLAWRLRQRGLAAEVASFSPLAAGMTRLTGVPVHGLAPRAWAADLPRLVRDLAPALLVLDAFPGGVRGERPALPGSVRVAYLARRLRWGAYAAAHPPAPVRGTIRLEALEPAHDAWLAAHGGELVDLPGPVGFPLEAALGKPDPALRARLDAGAPLVVHSGPPAEVEALLDLARRLDDAAPEPVLVTPDPRAFPGHAAFEAFPAARLFPHAATLVTGGGYNLVAEGAALGARHHARAFPRRWDDQAARLAAPRREAVGGEDAAAALARWVGA